MPPLAYALLFVAGFGGGFIDAVAGGGGLITVPALLATGMPPQMALGTNKLQSSFGTSIAVWHYARAGLMKTPALGLAAALAFFASMAGAHAVSVLHKDLLKQLIPWLLAAVAIYTVHFPAAGAMIGGQLLGARLGSALVVRKGAGFIRPVFLTVVFAMTLKLLWDAWRP